MRIYQEMKGRRHIILLLLCLFTLQAGIHAQPDGNYVKTVRMLDRLQSHGITSYQFYNGRGWPFLSATDGLGMSGNYAYTLQSYDAAGNVKTHLLTASEILSKDSIDYLGSLVMENGVPAQYLFAGGYCSLNDANASGGIGWHYYNRDHLGNNREVVSESGTLEQVTNYRRDCRLILPIAIA